MTLCDLPRIGLQGDCEARLPIYQLLVVHTQGQPLTTEASGLGGPLISSWHHAHFFPGGGTAPPPHFVNLAGEGKLFPDALGDLLGVVARSPWDLGWLPCVWITAI